MFCKNCGKESMGDKKFCTNCGGVLNHIHNAAQPHHTTIHSPKSHWWSDGNMGKILGIVVVVIIIIIKLSVSASNSLDQNAVDTNNKGLTAFDSGNREQAITQFQQASNEAVSNETKINTLKNLAYVYTTDGKDDLALSSFKKAIALTSQGSFDYYLISGEIADLENKPNATQLAFNKAYQLNSNDFQVNNSLAIFYLDLYDRAPEYVDYKKALEHAKKAYEQNKLQLTKKNLALAYYFNDNYDQTISLLSSIDLSNSPNYTYFLGLAYAQKDDPVNAKFYLNQAIAGGVEASKEVTNYIKSH